MKFQSNWKKGSCFTVVTRSLKLILQKLKTFNDFVLCTAIDIFSNLLSFFCNKFFAKAKKRLLYTLIIESRNAEENLNVRKDKPLERFWCKPAQPLSHQDLWQRK